MSQLNFEIVDAALFWADMSEIDKSGIWMIVEPNSPYGKNESEMFDCAIKSSSDNSETFPDKHLGSFDSLRKAKAYLSFLWQNGKSYDSLKAVKYVKGHINYEFELP